jgi:phenylacetate-CoA ligase
MAAELGPYEQIALHATLRHASLNSPYYRDETWADRLRRGGTAGLLEVIAVTPKTAVRDHTHRFYAEAIAPEEGKVLDKYTSGSTGEPTLIKKTIRHFQINARENARLKEGWRSGDHRKVLAIKSAREGDPFGNVEERCDKGRTTWTLFGLDANRAFELLLKSRATMIHCYPTLAYEILRLACERNEELELGLVSTVGEIVPDELRELAGERFGCRILDVYGTIETGIIAASCAHCGEYHPAERHLAFEVLRDDGSPASPGEIGRAVATPLFNAAMPLLRYETGDYVQLAEHNSCARSSIAIHRIIGRERNMFVLPDGRKITPMVPAKIAKELGIRQFKLVQTGAEDVELRYVLEAGAAPVAAAIAQAIIDTYLSKGLRARPVELAEIPRAPSGKYLMHESLVTP